MNKQVIISINLEEFQKIIADTVRDEIIKSQPEPQQLTLEYLSRKEVSKFLKISLPTLSDYTKKGVLKGYRIRGRVLYKQNEIESSLKEIRSIKYRRGA